MHIHSSIKPVLHPRCITDFYAGSFCVVHQIRLSLIAGSNLASLLKRTEYYLEVIKRLDNPHAETYLLLYRDTISSIMGVGCNHYSEVQENASRFPEEVVLYHKAMRAYWIGHLERCHHFTEKMIQGCESGGGQFRVFFMLYFGLNMFKIIRRTSPQEMKAIPRNCLRALKKAMELSRWNFRNKVGYSISSIFSGVFMCVSNLKDSGNLWGLYVC